MQYDLLIRGADVYAPQELGVSRHRRAGRSDRCDRAAPGGARPHAFSTRPERKQSPGVVETHAHMLLPFGGTQTMNDFFDGTRAGLYGGVTTLIDFADQERGGSILGRGQDAYRAGREAVRGGFQLPLHADGHQRRNLTGNPCSDKARLYVV